MSFALNIKRFLDSVTWYQRLSRKKTHKFQRSIIKSYAEQHKSLTSLGTCTFALELSAIVSKTWDNNDSLQTMPIYRSYILYTIVALTADLSVRRPYKCRTYNQQTIQMQNVQSADLTVCR